MTHIFEELNECKFKDKSFLFLSETTNSGKKTIAHEFPNSNERFTEELGEIPPTFNIRALIYGTIADRISFENILRTPGIGVLTHPIYGDVECVATNFTVTSSQTSIGEFIFNINFETSKVEIIPSPQILDKSAIRSNINSTKDSLGDRFEKQFKSPSTSENLIAMAGSINLFVSTVQENISKILNPNREKIADFKRVVDTITDGVWTIASNATLIKDTVFDLVVSVENLVGTPSELKAFLSEMVKFNNQNDSNVSNVITNYNGTNDAIQITPIDTVPRMELANNSSIFDELVKITCFSILNESYGDTNFNTDIEINSGIEDLNNLYNNLIRDASSYIDLTTQYQLPDGSILNLSSLTMDHQVLVDINTLRTTTKKVLDEKLKNSWKVTEITQKNISSMLLTTYRYFGNLDNKEVIISLNPEDNVSGFKETIKIIK